MRKSRLISIVAVICCVLMSFMYYINTVNTLTEMRNLVRKYDADIQTEIQARFEKVPNLVEIVKGAAQHEETIINSITEARTNYNKALTSGDTEAMLEADTAINAAFAKFEENYPEIAAMDLYKGLMDEYSGIEAVITIARKNRNEAVMQYNNKIERIPNSIVAKVAGFERIREFRSSYNANNPIVIDITK